MAVFTDEITLSKDFRKQAARAILSIGLFLVTYLVLIIVAIGLTIFCVYAGLAMIVARPMIITIGLGLGLASLGILVLIFLMKFVSQSRKVDRSGLVEISRKDEPVLYGLLDDIVHRVGTSPPKKVYLSPDVNAAVFYDSSFWSMFLPVRKNLMIGVGLVNTLTEAELKGVLAHEFGHFSQKTMKVGSYVYHVNQVIFNLLFENDGYNELIQRWAGISSYFSIFVAIAVKVVSGIQVILRGLYSLINKAYMGLSREMEFHADEIAALVTGPKPLMNALLRLNFAEQALEHVILFYRERTKEGLRSVNVFREQVVVIKLLAAEVEIPMVREFPQISTELYTRFNKSKLEIKDQWASHPTMEERVERLSKLSGNGSFETDKPASTVFRDFEGTQRVLSNLLWKGANLPEAGVPVSPERFEHDFSDTYQRNTFPKLYNGYYNNRNPRSFPLRDTQEATAADISQLFSREMVDKVYTALALQNDAFHLRQIRDGEIRVKTFDYEGRKFQATEAGRLLPQLESALARVNEELEQNDKMIYSFFRKLEKAQQGNRLQLLHSELATFEKELERDQEIYGNLLIKLQFVQTTTPVETIKENFQTLRPLEAEFKEKIRELLNRSEMETEITSDTRQRFENYAASDLEYFGLETYIHKNLELLFSVLNDYSSVLTSHFFKLKKSLLTYQHDLFLATGKAI
ncbi:MAG: M48 family metalloprotease [Cyclobacteriaceae bacterium]|nr:M48 family metalloprotease [Cyclobacteriaceae bacterium]